MMASHRKILLVDDDLDIRLLLKAVLSEEGYEVTAAGNGLEAIQEARLDPPDLIILDLMMPDMSGADFAGRIAGSSAPVLVISAASNAEETARELGAADLLRKPFELQTLLDSVAALVGSA